MRRHVLGKVAWLVAAGALSAAVATQADPVNILWNSNSGNRPTITEKPVDWGQLLIDTFEKAHPGIHVEHNYTGGEAYVIQIAGGAGPDVITSCCSGMHQAGVAGTFIDLTPFLGTVLPDYQKQLEFWPTQWGAFESEGHQFAIPQYLGTIAIYANTDMFYNAGVALPSADLSQNHQSWADFEAMCKKLTVQDASGRITQYGFAKGLSGDRIGYWMLAAGAKFYNDGSAGSSGLASPQAVQALSYLQRLKNQDQCMMGGGTVEFAGSQAAMLEDGSWSLASFIGADAGGNRKVPFGVQVIPLPIGPSGQRATLATIDGIGISKSTKHLDEALQLLKFLTSTEANTLRAEIIGLQPARKDVVPHYLNLMSAYNHESFEVNSHVFTDAAAYAYPQYLYADQKLADGILNAAYSKIFNDNAPVQNVWYSSVKQLNASLKAISGPKRPHEVIDVDFGGVTFKSQDINTVTYGTTEVADGVLTMRADGEDIWNSADGFRFTYQPVEGDFTAIVQLDQAPDSNEWGKGGIVVRNSVKASSPNIAVVGTSIHGLQMVHRDKEAASTADAGDYTGWKNGTPIWLKLVRKGDVVTSYYSSDKSSWTQLASVSGADLDDKVLVGMGMTSHAYGVQGVAKFEHWSLTQ